MKQALLLLTAGLILVGGVFVFADRAGLTEEYSRIAVSFMNTDAADDPVIVPANPDGTCDPGFHWKGDGFCESDPGTFDEEENEEETGGSDGGGIDWFFPDDGFVPCGKRGGEGVAIQEPCNICHAAELGQNILNFLVTTVMPFLAILFSAIGGFLIMTAGGNENRYRDGRDQLVRVVVGILIVLIAWAGINFVISTFFNEEVTGNWFEFECKVEQEGDVPDFIPQDWVFFGENEDSFTSAITGTPGAGGSGTSAGATLPSGLSCSDLAGIASYYKVPYPSPKNSDALNQLISCVLNDSSVGPYIDKNQIYTYDRWGAVSGEENDKLCNYTRGLSVCGARCDHRRNSCHYGGSTGTNGAEAVDFNAKGISETDLQNRLNQIRSKCGINSIYQHDGHNHVTTRQCDAAY